jgi:hypothetical protein
VTNFSRVNEEMLDSGKGVCSVKTESKGAMKDIDPLTPALNPSAQRCLTRFFTGGFAS